MDQPGRHRRRPFRPDLCGEPAAGGHSAPNISPARCETPFGLPPRISGGEAAPWSARIVTVRTRLESLGEPGPLAAEPVASGCNPAVSGTAPDAPASPEAPERNDAPTSTGSSSRRTKRSLELSPGRSLTAVVFASVPAGIILVGELSARMMGVEPDGSVLNTVR